MDAAHSIAWRPLGQLLVERGMLSPQELEHALAEQHKTGKRLGETIVALGYVSGPELESALAAQYGIELTTESGFGTGLRSQIQRRHEHDRRGGVRLAAVPLLAEEPQATEGTEPIEGTEETEAQPAEDSRLLLRLEEQWARLAAAEAALGERERELEELREVNDRLRAQLEEHRLSPESVRHETAPAVADSHLLFVQLDGRYAIVPRQGPPPLAHAQVRLPEVDDGGVFVVTGSRRSPLPGDSRPCVVALRAATEARAPDPDRLP